MKIIENDLISKYENYRTAGNIHKKVMTESINKIRKNMSILEFSNFIENKIKEYGGQCAFPANISLNSQAAHFTPSNCDQLYFGNDIIKIDIGVHVNGYIADGAKTIDLSGKYNTLIKASEDALKAAIEIAKVGTPIYKIGEIIENTITSYGFNPIRNLMGHGLGKYIAHDNPSIPNFNNRSPITLTEGQVIAIEPFATDGNGYVTEGNIKNIYSQIKSKSTRVPFIRDVLDQIKIYNGLPFASRWIQSNKTNFALNNLEKEGIIIGYPLLIEESLGMVSQKEHTIIIHEDNSEIIT